ncbi:MAG TPA: ABC transporter ATP-binding protein [Steroidobacteraceae bacterium]|nr:ABC transporter ATP-binding protein [Steroidobacteraceae bacterium]
MNDAALPRLQLRGITRRYGSVLANDGIDLTVMPGEIHALLGENGSGKSTLSRIICGLTRPDAGSIEWEGRDVAPLNPSRARALGIGMVFQHFALFESLTVAENIALSLQGSGREAELAARIKEVSTRYGLPLDPARLVASMSAGERQRVEIVRCLLQQPRLLILDEPTSVLSPAAIGVLFGALRQLAAEGLSILFISHKLDEVRALCARATVLRAGRVAGTPGPEAFDNASLLRLMLGAEPAACRLEPQSAGAPMLELEGYVLPSEDPFGIDLTDLSFAVHAGEIAGIAGISGHGQRELVAALAGETQRGQRGRLRIAGHDVTDLPVAARRAVGLALVPEERLGRGAVVSMSLAGNALLTGARHGLVRRGFIHHAATHAVAQRIISAFDVRTPGTRATAAQLSGGNLQKFIVGREIMLAPRVLVVAQPTWGVDVGAALRIRQSLIDLRTQGCGVLVISEDLEELFQICDRIAVIRDGRLSAFQSRAETSLQQIGQMMSAGAAVHA